MSLKERHQPLQLQPVVTQLLGFALGPAAFLLGHAAALGEATLAHAAVPELLPQFAHLQQQELGQAFGPFFICALEKRGAVIDSVFNMKNKGLNQRLRHSTSPLTQNQGASLSGLLSRQLRVLLRMVKLQ